MGGPGDTHAMVSGSRVTGGATAAAGGAAGGADGGAAGGLDGTHAMVAGSGVTERGKGGGAAGGPEALTASAAEGMRLPHCSQNLMPRRCARRTLRRIEPIQTPWPDPEPRRLRLPPTAG